jgi:transcriptional regulator with XRE-family HTH domain
MSESETIGARITQARLRYHITQAQLAVNVEVTRAAISQYEKDIIRPRDEVVERLARHFDVDPAWFMAGKGRSPAKLGPPLTVHQINVHDLTPQTIDNLVALKSGRYPWYLPAGFIVPPVDKTKVIAIRAPNDTESSSRPVRKGDRLVIYIGAIDQKGPWDVFLFFNKADQPEISGLPLAKGVQAVGRVIACLWTP